MVKIIKRHSLYFVYILKCSDGAYYAGYTNDLARRLEEHNDSHGSEYLKSRLPVELVYSKEYRYYKNVLIAEKRIKKMPRAQKENLISIHAREQISSSNLDVGAPVSMFPQRQEEVLP